MQRQSQVIMRPINKLQNPKVSEDIADATLQDSSHTFTPNLPNTSLFNGKIKDFKNIGKADVIYSDDLIAEIHEFKRLLDFQGLPSAYLVFNRIKIGIGRAQTDSEIIDNFLNNTGKIKQGYFELDASPFHYLDEAVHFSIAVARVLKQERGLELPVRFEFNRTFVEYGSVEVSHSDTPEDVFQRLAGARRSKI